MRLTESARTVVRTTLTSNRLPSNLRLTFTWEYNGLEGSHHCCALWGYYAGNRSLCRLPKRFTDCFHSLSRILCFRIVLYFKLFYFNTKGVVTSSVFNDKIALQGLKAYFCYKSKSNNCIVV